jgi:hypothetical protein
MQTIDVIAVSVLVLWSVATLALQFVPRAVFQRLRRVSLVLCLFPVWRLFAPDPVAHTYHLLVRVRRPGGDSGWHELHHVYTSLWLRPLVNPTRWYDKYVYTLVLFLIEDRVRDIDPDRSEAYQRLADYINDAVVPLGTAAAAFQFLIARSVGFSDPDPKVIFLSQWHTEGQEM